MSVFDPKQDAAALEQVSDHLTADLVKVVVPALEMALTRITGKLFAGYTVSITSHIDIKVDKNA